jgi:hypothetical protein
MWLLRENHMLGMCLGFWISADAYTNYKWISVLQCIFSIVTSAKIWCLWKTIFWTCVWDSGFQRTHIQNFGEFQFYNASFLLGLLLKWDCLGKSIFWACVWDSGFQRPRKQIFGESQFNNASFLLGLLLECDCLGKTIRWACVWDFGFQRTRIQGFQWMTV